MYTGLCDTLTFNKFTLVKHINCRIMNCYWQYSFACLSVFAIRLCIKHFYAFPNVKLNNAIIQKKSIHNMKHLRQC
jgi:hypothetical protein